MKGVLRRASVRTVERTCRTTILPLFLVACGEAASHARQSTGGDLAGQLTQELRIDGHEHDLVPFHPLSGGSLAVADDGTIAFVQGQDHRIRFFSEAGEPLGDFGRAGQGPGEFVSVSRLGWMGDTLWVFDMRLRRLTLVDPAQRLARTMPAPPYARPTPRDEGRIPGSEYLIPHATYADGSVTALVLPTFGEGAPEFVNRLLLAAVDPQGTIQQVMAAVPAGPEGYLRNGRGGSMARPFWSRSHVDVSRDGDVIAWSRGVADETDPHLLVTAVRPSGDTLYARSYRLEPIPVPGAVLDSVIGLAAKRNPDYRSQLLQMKEERIVYPPVQEMVAGRDGTVWIALADREGERPYLVLDPRGDPIGRVAVPARSRIAEAERGRIWVVERDEFDVESLVRYGVRW